jgi:hypothetical protein
MNGLHVGLPMAGRARNSPEMTGTGALGGLPAHRGPGGSIPASDRPVRRGGRPPACCCLVVAVIISAAACPGPGESAETVVMPDGWASRVVVEDMPDLAAIAVRPNGQSILAIDGETRSVVAFESDAPERRRTVLSPPQGPGRPVAIACVDSSTVALLIAPPVGELQLQTFRLQPSGEMPESSRPIQSQAVPPARRHHPQRDDERGDVREPAMAVSPGRDWLVLAWDARRVGDHGAGAGVPEPPILRAPIAGSRLGPLGTRHCPVRPASAVTVSPAGELVLFEPTSAGSDLVVYARTQAFELLRLPTGLARVAAAAYGRDGTLWAAATAAADDTEGLWRLDAAMVGGRQEVRATCVALVESPVALVPAGGSRMAVLAGPVGGRRLILVERMPAAALGAGSR